VDSGSEKHAMTMIATVPGQDVGAGLATDIAASRARAVENTGDARKAIGWFIIFCLVIWIWMMSAPSAFARGAPENLADLAEALSPAVVNISTKQTLEPPEESETPSRRGQTPFDELFDDFFQNPNGANRTATLGSGFIIDAAGIIVTNNHVIENADEIEVVLQDGTILEASVVGRDEKTDLAVLRVQTREALPHLDFADSEQARVGDWVMAIGNPFGLGGTVTAGIISARNRDFESGGPYANYIQTDAAINQGNSGGPLFDLKGNVVGVNTAIYSTTGGSIGIGFAIPSNQAKNVVDQILQFGEIRRGWLGVRVQQMSEDIAESLGLDKPRGALISEVNPDGPAAKAGFQAGDVILEFGSSEIKSMRDLPRAVADSEIGSDVDVKVLRSESSKTLTVHIVQMKSDEPKIAQISKPDLVLKASIEIMGLRLTKLTDALRTKFQIQDGIEGVLVVDVAQDSKAYGQVRPGDVIQAVSQKAVSSPKAVVKLVDDITKRGHSRPVLLMLNRGGNRAFVAVQNQEG
jgi:serine protease Do